MAEIKRKNIFNFFLILTIFLIDRVTKILIINLNQANKLDNYNLTPFLNFELIWNDGIAFGMLSFNEKIIIIL